MTAQPKGTHEWSVRTVNIAHGCGHDCVYCYAKMMARRFRPAVNWAVEVVDQAKVDRGYGRSRGVVMFPSSHDITPAILGPCLIVLRKLLAAGNQVLVVSKPHLVCVERLCAELRPYIAQVEFRFTITSASDDLLAHWEPGAPRYQERIACLDLALAAGFATSVSVEPFLDEDPVPLCRGLLARPGLREIWVGCMNYRNFPNYAPAKLAAVRAALSPDPRVRFKESFVSREAPTAPRPPPVEGDIDQWVD